MTPINPGGIRHLLVRAPNWLGDTVMALPALRALRPGVPRASITLVGPWVELLADQGVADRAIVYPRGFAARLTLMRPLRTLGADTVLLLPNSFESALTARLWGAVRRVGFATDGRARLLTHPVARPLPRPHQVDEYLELLGVFGITPEESTPTWILRASPDDSARVSALLREAGVAEDAPLVGLHLGAALGPSKRWPAGRWAVLAGKLARQGLVPVLLGPAADLPVAREVLGRCPTPVASLVGRDSPELLPRLVSRLTLLVSGDTGVAQLAAAMHVAVVTLFGPTDPRLTAPRGPRVVTIFKAVPCAPCFLPDCPIDHPCMGGIRVDEVLAAALSLAGARA